ncbi:MAG: thiamine pyrophosphate-binding protein, partial [Candidatus Angelobacter sp.]
GASGYGLFLSYLAEFNEDDLSDFISRLAPSREYQPEILRPYLEIAYSSEFLLSGAEAVAKLLERWHVTASFAFPGTSELALCHSITQVQNCRLMNSFGDKEAVFLSAGASLFAPSQSVAILHGARGLTNALGAIAETRRNEVGTIVLVGLPSTRSAVYLPPHGEDRLFEAAVLLSKHSVEVVLDSDGSPLATHNHPLLAALCSAMEWASTRPFGPTIIGLPQDVLEKRWVPWPAVLSAKINTARINTARPVPSEAAIATAARLIAAARRPVLFIDDYYLRYDDAIEALELLAALAAGVIYQLRYQRGAVLFERYPIWRSSYFAGWYDPYDPGHRRELFQSDLVITIEDRNMYPRVMGNFPPCRVIAITSDARKTTKNGYLRNSDVVLEGEAALTVRMVAEQLRKFRTTRP